MERDRQRVCVSSLHHHVQCRWGSISAVLPSTHPSLSTASILLQCTSPRPSNAQACSRVSGAIAVCVCVSTPSRRCGCPPAVLRVCLSLPLAAVLLRVFEASPIEAGLLFAGMRWLAWRCTSRERACVRLRCCNVRSCCCCPGRPSKRCVLPSCWLAEPQSKTWNARNSARLCFACFCLAGLSSADLWEYQPCMGQLSYY